MEVSKVEVLGPGCARCKTLESSARDAVERLGLACEVEKVSGMDEIIRRGVMTTPALAINGKIVSTGRVLNASEVEALLTAGGAS